MKKTISPFIYSILFIILLLEINSVGQTTSYCYPSGTAQSTGRVDATGKYDDLIRVGNGSFGQNIRGWATFDVSSIPDNATITSLQLRIVVVEASSSPNHDIDFCKITLLPSLNSASDVRNDIDNGDCYNCSSSSEGTTTGYKYIDLNSSAISYFQNTALSLNWFGIGMREYGENDDDCDIGGYYSMGNSSRPRLTVIYTLPCNTPTDLSESSITSSSAFINWSDVSGAQSYELQYREPGGTVYTTYPTLSNYSLTGLNSNTTYEYSVRTNCGSNNYSNPTSIRTFTTLVSLPDITIQNASVTPATVCAGSTINLSCDHYCSDGYDEAPNVGYFLSTNTTCTTTSDTYLGDDGSTICGSDPYDGENETLTIPTGISPGTYYICFIGDYLDEVSETNENNNCQYVQIAVTAPSIGPTSITATPSFVCSGNSSTLTVSGGSLGTGATWEWYSGSCGGTYLGSGNSITVSPSSTTTYYVRAEGNCNTTSCARTTVTVNLPAPITSFSGTPTSGTNPLSVQFSDLSTNSPASWLWNFGDGSTSTLQNPSHTYNNLGGYTVSLTTTNSCGSDTETITNYINVSSGGSAPVTNFSGTPTSGTAPLSVQFTDQSTNTPTNWSWDFGDGSTSTLENPTHTYNSPGSYTVSLTASNSYGSDEEIKGNYISVSHDGSAPIANFSATPTSGKKPLSVQFTDQSTNTPTSWSWDFGDGSTSTLKNPSHTYNSLGSYTVSLTASNSYGSDNETKTNFIYVDSNTGIVKTELSAPFKIYPNPAENELNIQFEDITLIGSKLLIYNNYGQSVYNCTLNSTINEIELPNLNSGIYFLKIRKKDMEYSEKIVIK